MDQHIISAWHLRAFARNVGRQRILQRYDKETDSFDEVRVDEFLAETDAHSPATEHLIGSIEAPAAGAALRLAKLTKPFPPSTYAVVEPGSATVTTGPPDFLGGQFEDTKLIVTQHQLAVLPSDRSALAAYAGLMYWRAPKVQSSIALMRATFDAAAQAVMDALAPGMRAGTLEDINASRAAAVRNATGVGERLASASWWVLRAESDSRFVLGDCPVGTTISLGHDDSWRAIFADTNYVVTMPLGPYVALVIAPQRLLPITGIATPPEHVTAVNRLSWRSAGRYVVARERADLEAAMPGGPDRRALIPVDIDLAEINRMATAEAIRITATVLWRYEVGSWWRWDRHLVTFGWPTGSAFDAEWVRAGSVLESGIRSIRRQGP